MSSVRRRVRGGRRREVNRITCAAARGLASCAQLVQQLLLLGVLAAC